MKRYKFLFANQVIARITDDLQHPRATCAVQRKNKNNKYPIIYSLVKGRSGSPVKTLGFKSLGVLSSGLEDQQDQISSIKVVKKNPNGKKALAACNKLGFTNKNSQLGSISVFYKDSKFTINPNPAAISKQPKP